jgi:glycosyltransferase involved in cell wall biosynthesis
MAFVTTTLNHVWGGADLLWTRCAEEALKQGHQVLAAISRPAIDHPRIRNLMALGAIVLPRDHFTTHRGRRSKLRAGFLHWIKSPRSLSASLEAFSPEYLFLSQGGAFDFLIEDGLFQWLRKTSCPYAIIVQSHSDADALGGEDRLKARDRLQPARRIYFVSSHNWRAAEAHLGFSLPNAELAGNPVELAGPLPLPWPTRSAARLAVVGRLHQDKGHDVLLDALKLSWGHRKEWQVHFFGRGPDETALRRQVLRLGLEDRVEFCGQVPDIRSIWEKHHLLALASRREGCSLAMLEALKCGRPALMTDVGGARDWIENGVNGWISPACTAEAVAESLERVWDAQPQWPQMGREAAAKTRSLPDFPERQLLVLPSPTSAP